MKPRDVFVFRIGQFGDTLVALPAIHRIAELHPGARLWLITNAPPTAAMVSAWDVLAHTGLFAGVIFYRQRVRELLRLIWQVRRGRDAVLYYLSPPRSAARLRRDRLFFRWACGLREIAALAVPHEITPRDEHGQLRVLPKESLRLLESVDRHAEPPPLPLLRPPPTAASKAAQLLAAFGGQPLIALGPGSKMPAKQWFLPRYLEICRRIVAQHPEVALVVLGGAEDREAGAAIVAAIGPERALSLAGQTSIIESAAVLARCALYVGNDTGTMHLAASMGVPCVAVFTSRENRDTWAPWGDQHSILRRELPCSGCMLERCERERMRCLDLISVDDVWREISPRLAEMPTEGPSASVLPCAR